MNRIILILILTFSFNVFSNTLPPTLSNFKIKKDQPSRVYFDSSEEITATNAKGFIIGSRSISGVKIISGKTTGHYFTVSKPFTFWDNDLIRYEGGSNLQDNNKSALNDFTLQYIHNNIPEPSGNGNVYYVSITGNDKNNGLSQNESWRTITFAATKAKAGDVVYIKAGDYGKEEVVIKNSGSKSKPIKFIGYKTTIGDVGLIERSVGMKFDSKKLPLLRNGKGTAISCKKKSYVIIRNIQIDGYSEYGINFDNSSFLIMDKVYVQKTKWAIRTIDEHSTNNRIINSYVANSSQTGVEVMNNNNLIDNTWAVSSYKSSMDYYLTIRGGTEGANNTIRNCYVNRFIGDSHSGHGISLKADAHMSGYSLEHNLIENCTIINSKLELRHRSVRNNIFRNILLDGNNGVNINDGASYNVLENITVKNSPYFVMWYESIENGGMNENGHHNTFKNCIGYNIKTLFTVGTYQSSQEKLIKNNNFLNCTFHNVGAIYTESIAIDKTNNITNSIFSSVKSIGGGKFSATQSYNNYYKGFKKPKGTGNIDLDPKFKNESKGDFRLELKSSLIDSGKKISDVKLDFAGSNRPQGSSHDIGAFEYYDNSTPVVKANAGPDQSICSGESITLTATGGESYSWNNGATTSSITVSPTSTKTYTVTATDGTSSATDDVVVSVNQVTADAGSDVMIDSGDSVTLTATGGDSYLWGNGATTASITLAPTTTTDYNVTVTQNGCEDTDTVQVKVKSVSTPIAIVANAGPDQSICSGESITLTASGGSSYSWSNGATIASITVNPTSTQTYTVTATDGTSSASDDVVVSVNQVTADAGSDVTIDEGESVKLTANGGDSYLWSTGETTKSITVTPNATTDYKVTVTKNGCEATDTVRVKLNNSSTGAVVANAGSDQSICQGESITLTATGGSSYTWSTGATTASITVSPTRTQTYTVTATDGTSSATDDVVTTVVDCETSAIEDELEARLELYPNPSEGIVNLNITGSEKDLNLVLVSTNGSVVYKDIINTKNTTVTKQVNLHGFTKGIYLVRLFNNDENLVKKLLII